MKILINAVSAKSGGAETYIRNLSGALLKIADENEYYIYVPEALASHLSKQSGKLEVTGVNVGYQSPARRLIWDQITLRKTLIKGKFDILFSSSDFGMLFPPCKQLLFIRNALFVSKYYQTTFLSEKSLRSRLYFSLQKLLIRMSIKHSDGIMVASNTMLESIKNTFHIDNVKAIVNYFGTSFDKFSFSKANNNYSIDKKIINLLYVSEYADYKNFSVLLKAIKHLADHGNEYIRLTLTINSSDLDKVESVTYHKDKELLEDEKIKTITTLTGYLSYEKLEKLYRDSDIFVFPSLIESYGHPLVEAMEYGLPVIASDTKVNREICGEGAIYFSPKNDKDLAEKILYLSNRSKIRRQLIGKGIKRASSKNNFMTHVKLLTEAFNTIA